MLAEAIGEGDVFDGITETGGTFDVNAIVEGRIIRIEDDAVLVDVGFKSEGTIDKDEWEEHEDLAIPLVRPG